MALFEASKYDPTDYVFNPMWRQGMYVLPFMARLGVTTSWSGWSATGTGASDLATGWTHPLHLRPVDWNVCSEVWIAVVERCLSPPPCLGHRSTALVSHVKRRFPSLAGLLWAASLWHWVFWDLDLFRDRRSNKRAIDSPKLFGIHLTLAGLLCLSFGSFHTATFLRVP